MGLDDWMVTLLILLALWTFVPRPIRRAVRSGLGPSIDSIAIHIRAGVRVLAGWIAIAAYRGLLGVPVPGSVSNIERERESAGPELPPAKAEVMTSGGADGQTDKTETGVSADPRECVALRLDKSKSNLIKVLVYNGWNVGDVRAAVKGENGAIGVEVQAARGESDAPDPDVHVTPIAGRVTQKKYFHPDEPELEYQAP